LPPQELRQAPVQEPVQLRPQPLRQAATHVPVQLLEQALRQVAASTSWDSRPASPSAAHPERKTRPAFRSTRRRLGRVESGSSSGAGPSGYA